MNSDFVNESSHVKLQLLEILVKWHSVYKLHQGQHHNEVLAMLFLEYEHIWNLFSEEGQILFSKKGSSLVTSWINGDNSSLANKGVCSQTCMEVTAHISKG